MGFYHWFKLTISTVGRKLWFTHTQVAGEYCMFCWSVLINGKTYEGRHYPSRKATFHLKLKLALWCL